MVVECARHPLPSRVSPGPPFRSLAGDRRSVVAPGFALYRPQAQGIGAIAFSADQLLRRAMCRWYVVMLILAVVGAVIIYWRI